MNETATSPALTQPPPSPAPVFVAGLTTTAAALAGVYFLSRHSDCNIMGWYLNFVIPAGALLVGLVAASGYGVVSWLTGVKITKPMLLTILALQVVAYFAALYIPFSKLHLPFGFWEYFDETARAFAWKQRDGSVGQPLGVWGYFFRFLEMVGFCFGSVIVPALLGKAPYCQACQMYMRSKQAGLLPASIPTEKIKKSDIAAKEAYEARQTAAAEQARVLVKRIWDLAAANNSLAVRNELQAFAADQKQIKKLPQRIVVAHVCCKNCRNGYLQATLLTGQGRELRSTALGTTPVPTDFAQL